MSFKVSLPFVEKYLSNGIYINLIFQ